ncbi:hypothetical protein GALMADRAFT_1049137 [Galerina marginata CBS 339.88]|uniref:Uncharacterized protein n=1 Tax=Galerina marginata (strain CBS 339.88) TaxID=685588 RepID=A0A067SE16_GALM3|nr:hypothetical protein GALMADRAFT_1049137 [Galerina marginata CBS 339.88]
MCPPTSRPPFWSTSLNTRPAYLPTYHPHSPRYSIIQSIRRLALCLDLKLNVLRLFAIHHRRHLTDHLRFGGGCKTFKSSAPNLLTTVTAAPPGCCCTFLPSMPSELLASAQPSCWCAVCWSRVLFAPRSESNSRRSYDSHPPRGIGIGTDCWSSRGGRFVVTFAVYWGTLRWWEA